MIYHGLIYNYFKNIFYNLNYLSLISNQYLIKIYQYLLDILHDNIDDKLLKNHYLF